MSRLLDDNGIKCVVFGSYGTLFDVQSIVERCKELFPDEGAELAILWRRKQLEYTWLLTLMDRFEHFPAVAERALLFTVKALDLPLTPEHRDSLLNCYDVLEHFAEAAQALRDLSPYRLALASNGSKSTIARLLAANGLDGVFETIVSAEDVQSYKPHPRLYLEVQKRLDLPPGHLLYVSSHSFDVTGAKVSGMRACWVNRKGDQWDGLGFVPDMTVGDLRELVEILAA